MALANRSLFLYGFEITTVNGFIDFQIASMGPVLTAIVPVGFYALTDYLAAIVTALSTIDPTNTYTASVDRTIGGGLQNRVTITSTGSFLSLLWGSGPHSSSNISASIGFPATDQTGAVTYTGNATAGTMLQPLYQGYNYVAPQRNKKVFGSVNVSTNGTKEAIVYQLQTFWEIEFMYEAAEIIDANWQPLNDWMIQQRPIEFTPDYTQPTVFYNGTLESTEQDGTGLAYQMQEMLPDFPGLFKTGKMQFRQTVNVGEFINS
jgi:hypothetical protein